MTPDLNQAIEQFHAALDEHDDKTCNMRSNGVVDGYAEDIVPALLAAGWRPPERGPSPEKVRWMRELADQIENAYDDDGGLKYYELARTLRYDAGQLEQGREA